MPVTQEFDGKVALITGAGQGPGRAIALALASRGAKVAIHDVTPVNLDVTLQLIREKGGQGRDYVTDISKKMPVQSLVDEVLSDFGRIDFLVNNASVCPSAPLLELDEWDWRRTIDVNLGAAFFLIQIVGEVMRAQGGGAIVNITGASSENQGMHHAALTASKQSLVGLTWAAAAELGAYRIRVNGITPPEPQTNLSLAVVNEMQIEPISPAEEDETVNMVLFLCSQPAENINGVVFDQQGMVLNR